MTLFGRHLLGGLVAWWCGGKAAEIMSVNLVSQYENATDRLLELLFHPFAFLSFGLFYGSSIFLLDRMITCHFKQLKRKNALFSDQRGMHLALLGYVIFILAILWFKFPRLTTCLLVIKLAWHPLTHFWSRRKWRKLLRLKRANM